jgi:PAS domain S-box-containing protein
VSWEKTFICQVWSKQMKKKIKKPADRTNPAPEAGAASYLKILKASELRLLRSEERYRRIFENIQDVYYEIEMNGTILEISPSIEKYASFKREDLIGRSIYDFYANENSRKVFLRTIQEKGYVRDFEIELLNHQGGSRICSITSAIVPGNKERPSWIVGCLRDISDRKIKEELLEQREEELLIKSRNLEEVNTALKVLLKQRENDRKEMEENVLTNVNASILPLLEKLKEGPLTSHQLACLEMINVQIREIISPFRHRLSQTAFDLTPQEMQVAELVKSGNSTKEIAAILGISIKTVDFHRDNLRKKLGLKNRQSNLRSFLLKFES